MALRWCSFAAFGEFFEGDGRAQQAFLIADAGTAGADVLPFADSLGDGFAMLFQVIRIKLAQILLQFSHDGAVPAFPRRLFAVSEDFFQW